MTQDEVKRPAVQSYLPSGFTMCSPELGFAQGSLKTPVGHTDLLHCVEVDDPFQTTYLLRTTNIRSADSKQLCIYIDIITIKHHMVEGWYFADGALLSTNGIHATKFLLDASYTYHSQSITEMNKVVEKVIPMMLRRSGVSSIPLLLHLSKYTWLAILYTYIPVLST